MSIEDAKNGGIEGSNIRSQSSCRFVTLDLRRGHVSPIDFSGGRRSGFAKVEGGGDEILSARDSSGEGRLTDGKPLEGGGGSPPPIEGTGESLAEGPEEFGLERFDGYVPDADERTRVFRMHTDGVRELIARNPQFVLTNDFQGAKAESVRLVGCDEHGNETLFEVGGFSNAHGDYEGMIAAQFFPAGEESDPRLITHVFQIGPDDPVQRRDIDYGSVTERLPDPHSMSVGQYEDLLSQEGHKLKAMYEEEAAFGLNDLPVGEDQLEYVLDLARRAEIEPVSFVDLEDDDTPSVDVDESRSAAELFTQSVTDLFAVDSTGKIIPFKREVEPGLFIACGRIEEEGPPVFQVVCNLGSQPVTFEEVQHTAAIVIVLDVSVLDDALVETKNTVMSIDGIPMPVVAEQRLLGHRGRIDFTKFLRKPMIKNKLGMYQKYISITPGSGSNL